MYPILSNGDVSHLDYYFDKNFAVETNIPTRPTFKLVEVYDAVRIQNIVGKYAAFKIAEKENTWNIGIRWWPCWGGWFG